MGGGGPCCDLPKGKKSADTPREPYYPACAYAAWVKGAWYTSH